MYPREERFPPWSQVGEFGSTILWKDLDSSAWIRMSKWGLVEWGWMGNGFSLLLLEQELWGYQIK